MMSDVHFLDSVTRAIIHSLIPSVTLRNSNYV